MTFMRDLPYFSSLILDFDKSNFIVQFSLYEKSKDLLNNRFGESSFSSFVAGNLHYHPKGAKIT